jgi:hypothetical protein
VYLPDAFVVPLKAEPFVRTGVRVTTACAIGSFVDASVTVPVTVLGAAGSRIVIAVWVPVATVAVPVPGPYPGAVPVTVYTAALTDGKLASPLDEVVAV